MRPAEIESFKWYTHVRRFPQLIGKTPDGRRIWGGPYTQSQVIVTAGILYLGSKTQHLWGIFGLVGNAVALLTAAGVVGFLLGRLPIGMRNPATVLTEVWTALSAPATGRCGGVPIRLRRPHRPRFPSRVLVDASAPVPGLNAPVGSPPSATPRARGGTAAGPRAVLPTAPPATLTGVQRLLAGIEKD